RFQLWLHEGDEIAARFEGPLAKSRLTWRNSAAVRLTRKLAGYPEGQRHELVSLDMIERSSELKARVESDGADWHLVLHLVAAHHGWCRPLAPFASVPADEADPVRWEMEGSLLEGSTAHGRGRLDSGVAERFWELNRRY